MALSMPEAVEGFHNREWLSTLMARLKLTPLRAAAAMALVNLLVDLPLAISSGAFRPGEHPKILEGLPADLIYEFLVHPVTLAYFCWLQTAGGKLFGELLDEKLTITQKRASTVLEKWIQRLQSPSVSRSAALASLFFAGWYVLAFTPDISPIYPDPPYHSWVTVSPIIAIVRAPVTFAVFYALVLVIVDLVMTIRALNDLLAKQGVRVEPFHPDKAGGLSIVGRFAANLSYLIGTYGLLLFVRILENEQGQIDISSYVFFTGVILYLVLAPIIFFIPLWTTHLAMVAFRDDLLGKIAGKMEATFGDLGVLRQENEMPPEDKEEPVDLDAEQVEKLTKKVQNLNKMRQFVRDNVPVWPFNVGNLRRFYTVVVSPVFSTAVVIIRDLLFG